MHLLKERLAEKRQKASFFHLDMDNRGSFFQFAEFEKKEFERKKAYIMEMFPDMDEDDVRIALNLRDGSEVFY